MIIIIEKHSLLFMPSLLLQIMHLLLVGPRLQFAVQRRRQRWDKFLKPLQPQVLQRHILGPKEIQLHPTMQEMQVTEDTTPNSVGIINTESVCVANAANANILQYVRM